MKIGISRLLLLMNGSLHVLLMVLWLITSVINKKRKFLLIVWVHYETTDLIGLYLNFLRIKINFEIVESCINL